MSPVSNPVEWTKPWRPHPAKQNAVPGSAETSESDSGKVRFLGRVTVSAFFFLEVPLVLKG